MIDEALSLYGFADMDALLIRHNENMTYRVGGKYLLRIHKHIEGFSTELFYEGSDRIKLREGELDFLVRLRESGLRVQSPVPNRDGRLVTLLSCGVPVTVLTWIEGRTVDKGELCESLCREMGEMVAALHGTARGCPPVRAARYDAGLCGRLTERLGALLGSRRLTSGRHDDMSGALRTIGALMSRSGDEMILVHSDLSLSNMLITPGGLVPIDFSLFGYGNPMLDIGGLFGFISDVRHRSAILEGYESASGRGVDGLALDCCFALQVLLGIIIHYDRWENEDWFAEKLAGWCGNIFRPLAEGERVIKDVPGLNYK